jgi:hypothetical protein
MGRVTLKPMAPSQRRRLRRASQAPVPAPRADVDTIRVLLKQARTEAHRLATLLVEIDKLFEALPPEAKGE